MATYEDSKYICILDEKHSIYALTNGTRRSIEKEFGFHLGLILLIKPSSLGFTALRIPFHRDPYRWAPPALGDPNPQLHPH